MLTSNARGYHHGDLHDALLGAALEILNEAGAAELSLRAVARRAGVSAMAPYRHFADKQSLLAAVAERGHVSLRNALRVADGNAPAERLIGQGVAYVAFAVANPALFRLMFGATLGDFSAHPGLHAAGVATFGTLQAAVQALFPHAPAAQQSTVAMACWSMVHGLAALRIENLLGGIDLPPEAIAGTITGLVTRALDSAINNAPFSP